MTDIFAPRIGWFAALFAVSFGLCSACGGSAATPAEPAEELADPEPGDVQGTQQARPPQTPHDDSELEDSSPIAEPATDDEPCSDLAIWYFDSDQDGFGDVNHPTFACASTQPAWFVDNASDCDDQNHNV